ncbi:MAG: type II secretion system protein [Sporichthyaceae bacterium]
MAPALSILRTARRRRAPKDRGLTLIELLIVLTIMGVLSGIAMFSMGGLDGKSRIEACKTDAAAIAAAQQAYKSSIDPATGVARGLYAPSIEVLQAGEFLARGATLHTVVTRTAAGTTYLNPVTATTDPLPSVYDATVFYNPRIAAGPAPGSTEALLVESRPDDSFFYLATRPVPAGKNQPCIPNLAEAIADSPRPSGADPLTVAPETLSWLLTLQNSETVL